MAGIPFAQADKKYKLTRHGAFDAGFDNAYLYEGDLAFAKNATGADVLKAFGFKKPPSEPGLFVVTGKLSVQGGLDLDAGLHFSLGLAVLGDLEARALRLDMTMLFVFGDARVEQAILFETSNGTLSVAKKTICPLVICHEGDLNVAATGEVFDSSDEGPFEGASGPNDDADDRAAKGFPSSKVTMTVTEALERLVAAVFEDGELDGAKAFRRAGKGQSLFRPVKAGALAKKAAPALNPALSVVPMLDACDVTSLLSDGEHLWMGAASLLMFDGKRFTRTWRKNPKGACDDPPDSPSGIRFTRCGASLVASGSAPYGITLAASDDLGIHWRTLPIPNRFALMANVTDGVACFHSGHTLSRASAVDGPWQDLRIVAEGAPHKTAQHITPVGQDIWISLLDREGKADVFVVRGTTIRHVDYASDRAICRIIATADGGVLLLGDGNTVLLTHDDGVTFTKGKSTAVGDIEDATRVGEAIYAVGGLPWKKGAKSSAGFFMRSLDGGRTFEMIADDLPGRMRAVAAHGDRVFLAGAPKTAFAYALPER